MILNKKKIIKKLNEEIIELKTENNDLKYGVDLLNNQRSELQIKLLRKDVANNELLDIIECLKSHQVPKIKKIVCNEKKKATTVFFDDKEKRIVKCAKGVKYDKYTAVAYAIVEELFKSNSKFKRAVDKLEGK